MADATPESDEGRDFLSAVALLRDLPERGLVRGQVGTVVEALDDTTALVEFSDDQGRLRDRAVFSGRCSFCGQRLSPRDQGPLDGKREVGPTAARPDRRFRAPVLRTR